MNTTTLPMKTVTMHSVKYYDLEAFIQEQFDRPDYSLIADQECSNDSTHTFSVRAGAYVGDYERNKVAEFKYGSSSSFITAHLMQDMFERGLIPEGDYLVEVSW